MEKVIDEGVFKQKGHGLICKEVMEYCRKRTSVFRFVKNWDSIVLVGETVGISLTRAMYLYCYVNKIDHKKLKCTYLDTNSISLDDKQFLEKHNIAHGILDALDIQASTVIDNDDSFFWFQAPFEELGARYSTSHLVSSFIEQVNRRGNYWAVGLHSYYWGRYPLLEDMNPIFFDLTVINTLMHFGYRHRSRNNRKVHNVWITLVSKDYKALRNHTNDHNCDAAESTCYKCNPKAFNTNSTCRKHIRYHNRPPLDEAESAGERQQKRKVSA